VNKTTCEVELDSEQTTFFLVFTYLAARVALSYIYKPQFR